MRKKRYIEGMNPQQATFLPECLDEIIPAESMARFIEVYVEQLDMKVHGFNRSKPAETGRPAYDPRALLKLYLYGFQNRIRSSRRMEKEAHRNIELWWLLGKLTPDHNTIADFRKDNRKALVSVFKSFVRLCMELKLINGEQICADGTPFKADNGLHRSTSMELSQKKLDYAREQLRLIERYMTGLDEADKAEQGALRKPFAIDLDPQNLPDPEEIRRRIALHEAELEQMMGSGTTQILYTDPEARVMPAKQNGKKACYNIQTAVETKGHMIVGFVTTNACNDMNQLAAVAEEAKENLDVETISAIADKGYESAKDIQDCLMKGIVPDVGFQYDREERVFNLDHVEGEISEERRASSDPKDIKACLHAGVLPTCYENTNISIEVQRQSEMSCFIRHEDGAVTCPMGKTLLYVPVIMYGSPRYPLQKIPDVEQPNRYNAFGRVKRKDARVMIFIKRDILKQKLRMQVNEHPFGTIKHHDNAGYFLCRGKEMVSAEIALCYLSYNIRRAISLAGGVSQLITLLNDRKIKKSGFGNRP